jgi:NAD(P)-dependent dehydrogenase (short-subunit alcohol dehydrogenase family)
LAARGFRVILTARRRKEGEAAAAGLPNTTFVELDITNDTSVQRTAAMVSQLDVLIHSAAVLLDDEEQDVLQLKPSLLQETLAVNAVAAVRVAQAFVPHLLNSPAGRIVNVSSAAGQLSDMSTWAPAYCISKAALNAVTCQFAVALRDRGVAVNSISPGWCRTDMGGPEAPRSAEEGAADIVWLAAEAPQELTGRFLRERQVIPW